MAVRLAAAAAARARCVGRAPARLAAFLGRYSSGERIGAVAGTVAPSAGRRAAPVTDAALRAYPMAGPAPRPANGAAGCRQHAQPAPLPRAARGSPDSSETSRRVSRPARNAAAPAVATQRPCRRPASDISAAGRHSAAGRLGRLKRRPRAASIAKTASLRSSCTERRHPAAPHDGTLTATRPRLTRAGRQPTGPAHSRKTQPDQPLLHSSC